MKGLIIAAGAGTRLRDLKMKKEAKPKPLIKLLGLSLIERAMLTAKEAGIDEFVIVVGYLGEKIREKLGDGTKYGIHIDYVENDEWQRGNGVSVLKAKGLLNEEFVAFMADHIFEAETLKKLKEIEVKTNECFLVVDKKVEVDTDEATKVRIEDQKIVDIGKKIDDYNGFDCGIFLLSPSIFDALEESVRNGDETLSGGIRILSKKGKMNAFDIGDGFWMDIDTKEDHKKAEKLLLKKLTKTTDGPVSRYLNRPISTRISKFLVKTRIKPNAISLISFFVSLLSALFFGFGSYLYTFIGGVLSQLSSVFDGCDGEVARLKFLKSEYGGWFDSVLDRYADGLIIFGMMCGLWTIWGGVEVWIVGFFAIIGSFMNSYTAIKYDTIFEKGKARIRFGRDIRLLLIAVGAILNQLFCTLIILGILTNGESIRRLLVLRNK
jgi:CDP-L-myo-inositol myo-inositolphosphotransferase